MKLFMNKNEKYEEPEVHMFFHKQTKEVEQVEKFVRSLSITIPAKYEDETYKLYPTDIYYIETIDRRTYLYTASQVYESSENLQWIVWKKIVICKERNGYILWVLRAPDEYRKVIYRDENRPDEVSLRLD